MFIVHLKRCCEECWTPVLSSTRAWLFPRTAFLKTMNGYFLPLCLVIEGPLSVSSVHDFHAVCRTFPWGKWPGEQKACQLFPFLLVSGVMENTVVSLCLQYVWLNFSNLLTEVHVWLSPVSNRTRATNHFYRTLIEGLRTVESFSQLESCLGSNVLSKNHDIHSSINR